MSAHTLEAWEALIPLALYTLRQMPAGSFHAGEDVAALAEVIVRRSLREALAFHSLRLEDEGRIATDFVPGEGCIRYLALDDERRAAA